MEKPLSLSVNTQCFEVEPIISCEAENGEKIILDARKINVIEYKRVNTYYMIRKTSLGYCPGDKFSAEHYY